MWLKRNIPNALTLGNLLCGCLAILQVFEGDLVWAAYFVGIALVLDFFDGFTARLLKVSSPIGKDLDSLADMVTFGVVPGMVIYKYIELCIMIAVFDVDGAADQGWTIYPPLSSLSTLPQMATAPYPSVIIHYAKFVALLIPIFSCIRLAKFNNDTRQSDSFIGLPTPANAMVICSLPLILHFHEDASIVSLILNVWVLHALSIGLSLLLVAELPLFALKFKGFSWADPQNRLRYVFLLLSLVLVICLQVIAIPLVILLYILLSIVNNLFIKKKG